MSNLSQAESLAYQCLAPVSAYPAGDNGVVVVYLDVLGTASVVFKDSTGVLALDAQFLPALDNALDRARASAQALAREIQAGDSRSLPDASVLSLQEEVRVLKLVDPLGELTKREAMESEAVAWALHALGEWIVQDASQQGHAQPAVWGLANRLHSSSPELPLRDCLVGAFLGSAAAVQYEDGALDALSRLALTDRTEDLRVSEFLRALKSEASAVRELSLYARLQVALNRGLLYRAARASCALKNGKPSTIPCVRYRLEDLVKHGFLPRARALAEGLRRR